MTDPTTAMRAAREALEKIAEPISSRRNDTEWLLMVIDLRRRIAMDALAQLDAALAQPSEEARDAARLDAIERNIWFVEPQYQNDPATWRVGKATGSAHAKTLRGAIDAALQAKDGAR
ncbi:hypothetical protein [Caldimonas sp. KR1-144]|uniref:hypothetical protein n=1 Tax=Caldimonas sp. KR1-144 TaxID=3400911 RepID=UPI003C0942C3